MVRAGILLLCLVFLPLPSGAAGSSEPDEWAAARARFASAMGEIASAVDGVQVTSKHRSEADQIRLAALGYKPHPRSQHKLGLAWDLLAPAESLDALQRLATEKGFVALRMISPVTGNPYLHVQRYVRSPLGRKLDPEPEPVVAEAPPAEAAAAEPEPVIEPPRPIDGTRLAFPRRLLRKPVDGRIVLLLEVSEEGRVLDLEVDSSDLPEFEDFVASEVRRWTFHPPTREGRPVVAIARLPIPIRIE